LLSDNTVKKDPNAPALNLPGKVQMSGKEFGSAIKNISLASDKIRFIVGNGIFTVESVGEGQDKTVKPYSSDELLHIGGDGNSMFSTDYLNGMARSMIGDIVINLGVDHPMIMEFEIAGGHGTGKYLLAPRIEND
jgi:proliferating cell nuclear antigen